MPNMLRGGEAAGSRAYFDVVVAGSYCGNSKEKGTPFIGIVFAHKAEPDWGITGFRYLTTGTIEYVAKDLAVLGWDAVKQAYRFEELDGNEKSAICGAECTICIEEEEYNGKLHPKVAFINPLGTTGGGAPREQMSARESKSWAAKVREALGVGAPARPGAAPRAPLPATKAAERTARTRQAVKDGIANQTRGAKGPAPSGAAATATDDDPPPTEEAPPGDDPDFESIPF